MNRWLGGMVAGVAGVLLLAPQAGAHQPGQTLVTVSTGGTADAPTLELVGEITLDRLDLAYELDLSAEPHTAIVEQHDLLIELIGDRVSVTEPTGEPWGIEIGNLAPSTIDGYVTFRVDLTASPPEAGTSGSAVLRWDVVTDLIYSHKVFVAATDADGATRLLGTMAHHQPTFTLAVQAPASAPVQGSLFGVGFEHFRQGPDHLLFLGLIALGVARQRAHLGSTIRHLGSPLDRGGSAGRRLGPALRRLGMLTVAFTIGHSASLAIASLGWLTLPGRLVETGIAASILIAAIHAVRPFISTGSEAWFALGFGFIHGFGFAGTLADLDLQGADLIAPLLTFNVGLEVAQLLALGIVGWQFWIIARSRVASAAIAAVVGVISVSWISERGLQTTNPLGGAIETALASPERLAIVLVAVAAITHLLSSRRSDRDVLAGPLPARVAIAVLD